MKALKSPLAKRVMAAGIRPQIGRPFFFEGKWYAPTPIPVPRQS